MGDSTLQCTGRDDLAARSRGLQAAVLARIAAVEAPAPDAPMQLFAEGLRSITERLPALERATSSVVYNLNRRSNFDPQRREREPNQHTRARGIQGHLITSPVDHLSLVAACHPDTWVAPVQFNGLVIDERLGVFAGPLTPDQQPTAWLCRDQDLIMMFCDLWWETKRHAVPIRDAPGVIPLTERQLEVAALLGRGAKDATIARRLGVSPRTVTNDIGRLLNALGASSRWEGGMVLGRACPTELAV